MRMNSMSAILSLTDASNQDLKPLTRIRPVASLPFAARYRAIDFALSNISHAGIDSVAIFIGGSGRSIYDHIRSGSTWDLESRLRGGIFTYSQTFLKQRMDDEGFDERDFYKNHRDFLEKSRTEFVVIGSGRMITKLDLINLKDFHSIKNGEITVIYKNVPAEDVKGHQHERVVELDAKGNVTRLVQSGDWDFTEDTVAQSLNIYVLTVNKMLEILERAGKEGIQMDIDRLVAYYSQFYNAQGFEYTGPLMNLDSIQSYYKANMDLLDTKNYHDLFLRGNNVITKVKNEPPTYYSEHATITKSIFATGSYIEGKVNHSMIFRRVKIGKNAEVNHSIVMQGSKIGEGAVLEYCVLDKNVIVEPGAIIKGTKDKVVVIEKNRTVTA